jgi:hypothetical protein
VKIDIDNFFALCFLIGCGFYSITGDAVNAQLFATLAVLFVLWSIRSLIRSKQ